jgi:hypothetical protein
MPVADRGWSRSIVMGPTHAAIGLALVTPLLWLAPQFAVVGALAAVVGGFSPDADVLIGIHRRTLHFPVLGWPVVAAAAVVAVLSPGPWTVAAVCFALAATVHASIDVLGAGTELRPWRATEDRAIYVHPIGRWLEARRYVRYDGSPEDLALTVVFSVPGILLYDGVVRQVAVGLVLLGTLYALVRKRLPDAWERILAWVGIE